MDTVPRVVVVAGGAGSIGEGIVRTPDQIGDRVLYRERSEATVHKLFARPVAGFPL